jgi:23S rRNA pseudouridine2605 synthase
MKKNNENKPRRSDSYKLKRQDNVFSGKKTNAGERPASRRKDTKPVEDKPFKKPYLNKLSDKPDKRFKRETEETESNPRAKRNTAIKPKSSEEKPAFADKKPYTTKPSTRGKARFESVDTIRKKFNSSSTDSSPLRKRVNSKSTEEFTDRKKSKAFSGNTPEKRRFKSPEAEAENNKRNEFNPADKRKAFKPRQATEEKAEDTSRTRFPKPEEKEARKRAFTEERPQKRTSREGYYTDKKKASTNRKSQTPEYNLKRYEAKKETKSPPAKQTIRLNRYISNAGICSRRDADVLIESGEIKVNGKVVTELGYQVNPNDTVKYGNRVLNKEKMVYLLLNKPKDFITTTEDPDERKTVMDLVKNACEQRIYPVGRLDRNTTGLLLLTNDGELAEKLAHPSNNVKKVYQVELDKPITKDDYQKIVDGIELEDGKVTIDDLAIVSSDATTLGLEIHLGRNRIVRRLFEHLGYEVIKLDRVVYAGLTKKDLPRGNWRFLNEKEVITLKYLI